MLFIWLVAGALAGGAAAQTSFAPTQQNLPPVAAPTSTIEVAPIEVVRSVTELVNDFGGGLMQGLLASHGAGSGLIIAAQDNRIIATRSIGCCIASDARFGEGLYSDVFAAIAVLQLVEQQRLSLDAPVPQATNVTVEQVLTHQADPTLLRTLVATGSGMEFRNYISQNILSRLGSDQPAEIAGRLLVALLNDGSFEGRQILQPDTNRLMGETHFSLHPALPGWTYGLAEMRRNGWRALQWDGQWSAAPASQARLVLVPDARVAYFILIEGQADSSFWRTLDEGLFDRILPQRASPISAVSQAAVPDAGTPDEVAGAYEASSDFLSLAAPLKAQGRRLVARIRADGTLILSGGENAVLARQEGGYWRTEGGNLNAAARDGRLILSSGIYRPLRLWKRPEFYASLALMFGVAAVGAVYGEWRIQRARTTWGRIRVVLLWAVAAFLVAALLAWHVSPAPS